VQLYVWIYDPVPAKTFIIGLLLGNCFLLCLFHSIVSRSFISFLHSFIHWSTILFVVVQQLMTIPLCGVSRTLSLTVFFSYRYFSPTVITPLSFTFLVKSCTLWHIDTLLSDKSGSIKERTQMIDSYILEGCAGSTHA